MKALVLGALLTGAATLALAQSQDAAPNTLRLAPQEIDLATRDTLSDSINATADRVIGVADRLAQTRNDLVRCMNPLVDAEGTISDWSAMENCLTDEAVSARDSFTALGGAFTEAEAAMRDGSARYRDHAEGSDAVVAEYQAELALLDKDRDEILAFRASVQDYVKAGNVLDSTRRQSVREAAYRLERKRSRAETVQKIIAYKEQEKAFFLQVSANLEHSADQLNAQSYRAYHEADKQSDYIELAAARQDVRNIRDLQVGARTDFSTLWESVGDITRVFDQIGADRARLDDASDFALDSGEWPEVTGDDDVVTRFLGDIDLTGFGAPAEAEGN